MSVTLINPFEVPEGKEEEALAFCDRVAEYMRKQPGFISTRLHKAVVPWARFYLINGSSPPEFLGICRNL